MLTGVRAIVPPLRLFLSATQPCAGVRTLEGGALVSNPPTLRPGPTRPRDELSQTQTFSATFWEHKPHVPRTSLLPTSKQTDRHSSDHRDRHMAYHTVPLRQRWPGP